MAEIPSPISTVVPVVVQPLVPVGVQVGVQSPWKRMEMVPLQLLPVLSFLPMEEVWAILLPVVVVVDPVDLSDWLVKPLPTTEPFVPKVQLPQPVVPVAVVESLSITQPI